MGPGGHRNGHRQANRDRCHQFERRRSPRALPIPIIGHVLLPCSQTSKGWYESQLLLTTRASPFQNRREQSKNK